MLVGELSKYLVKAFNDAEPNYYTGELFCKFNAPRELIESCNVMFTMNNFIEYLTEMRSSSTHATVERWEGDFEDKFIACNEKLSCQKDAIAGALYKVAKNP